MLIKNMLILMLASLHQEISVEMVMETMEGLMVVEGRERPIVVVVVGYWEVVPRAFLGRGKMGGAHLLVGVSVVPVILSVV